MAHFRESVVVITGASAGIGRALAMALAPDRPKLVLAARNSERLEKAAEDCRRLGADTLVVPTDVTRADDCRNLIERAAERFGRVDTLVNNAAQAMWARFDELADPRVVEDIMRLNYLGAVYCTHHALPHLKHSRGLVVAMASVAGLIGVPLMSGYAASKHALIGFFESLRIELAGTGIGVTIVAPDFVQSEILALALDATGKPRNADPMDQRNFLTADACAWRIVKGMRRRERLVLTSHRARWGRWGRLLVPRLVDGIAAMSVGFR
jgi:short-subunit dehydrogenase